MVKTMSSVAYNSHEVSLDPYGESQSPYLHRHTIPMPVPDRSNGTANPGSERPNDNTTSTIELPIGSFTKGGLEVIAPNNFLEVVDSILFRSGFPQNDHVHFVKQRKPRCMLILVDPNGKEDVQVFSDWPAPIEVMNIQLSPNKKASLDAVGNVKQGKAMDPDMVVDILRSVFFKSQNYPLWVHCNAGLHRTGCVIACFLKFLAKELPEYYFKQLPRTVDLIIAQYWKTAGKKGREGDERFIRGFDTRVVGEYFWKMSKSDRDDLLDLLGASKFPIDG